ncbi:Acetyl-CoA acetyltransferase, partial [Haemophilus influenzae]
LDLLHFVLAVVKVFL